MNKFFIILCLFLSACGTMGIGSNHNTIVHNDSKNTITITSDRN